MIENLRADDRTHSKRRVCHEQRDEAAEHFRRRGARGHERSARDVVWNRQYGTDDLREIRAVRWARARTALCSQSLPARAPHGTEILESVRFRTRAARGQRWHEALLAHDAEAPK